MQPKRVLAVGVLVALMTAGLLAAGISSSGSAASACACVTVNQTVVEKLNRLDALVQLS